jgi:UDP-2,4-diacetamido-2,4,6-trideoxy-beta-L-altropyranose hydrolase
MDGVGDVIDDISAQHLRSNELRVCIVTTSGNPHVSELETFVHERKNITLEIDSAHIAQLLHQSRLAIITPSVMIHEVLYMEIPFIAIKTASNQQDLFVYLKEKNYSVWEEWNVDAITQFYNT